MLHSQLGNLSRPSLSQAQGIQATLSNLNHQRLTPSLPGEFSPDHFHAEQVSREIERAFLEADRASVAERAVAAPSDPMAFADWFDALRDNGPGQHDPLFDYLAHQATLEQFRWFIHQEVAGEAGFDDLVALTQLRMPERTKLELARNYWDEMGRGKPAAMHGPMLNELARALGLPDDALGEVVPESLALSNLLVGLAFNRCYAFHALGALGAIELTAPTRAVKLVEGFDRLGLDRSVSHYFRVHAVVDIAHARTWRDEILIPLVADQPGLARHLAEGALMRLQAGARTFERYRRHFGLPVVTETAELAWLP